MAEHLDMHNLRHGDHLASKKGPKKGASTQEKVKGEQKKSSHKKGSLKQDSQKKGSQNQGSSNQDSNAPLPDFETEIRPVFNDFVSNFIREITTGEVKPNERLVLKTKEHVFEFGSKSLMIDNKFMFFPLKKDLTVKGKAQAKEEDYAQFIQYLLYLREENKEDRVEMLIKTVSARR